MTSLAILGIDVSKATLHLALMQGEPSWNEQRSEKLPKSRIIATPADFDQFGSDFCFFDCSGVAWRLSRPWAYPP
jgi:hypothetical protein